MEHQEHQEHQPHQPHVPHTPAAPKAIVINFDRRSFIAGIAAGILVLLAIGFFILLGLMISGKGFSAAKVLKKTADAAQPAAGDELAAADVKIPDITTDDYIRGDKNAAVSIVEYSDTECPFCKRFHDTLVQMIDASQGKVNWVYRSFPLASLHSKAPKEAEALECAGELGGNEGFWKYMDRMMAVTPSNDGLDAAQLPEIAKFVGMDSAKFQTCYDSGKFAEKVQKQYDDAIAAGGRGTPFSVLVGPDGTMVPLSGALPAEQIQSAIDGLLKS